MINWVLFSGIILGILILDLVVFHRKAHKIKFSEALIWSAVWIALALLFNLYIYFIFGKESALQFLTGYLIEKALSIDNLFVFLLIFNYFQTPITSLHKVLFWGVLGALIMRAIFIALGIALIQKFYWMTYLFGAFLILTGIKLGFEKNKEIHPEKNPLLRFFRFIFPVTHEYKNDNFFIRERGKLFATPLFLVLIAVETTDVIFALDSIPAILAITYDPFIVFTSNIFAILGLRSLFFVLANVMPLFHHLHYALCLILVFIGLKMILASMIKIPIVIALGVIFVILVASILSSIIFPPKNDGISSHKKPE